MTIEDVYTYRNIRDILHFTTNRGLIGTITTGAVKSRHRLPEEKYLEYVYEPNCAARRDTQWLDYVNLSITRINRTLFDISKNNWHKNADKWWCVLAFDPTILTHPGVMFVTTNNMWSGARRGSGAAALEALFAVDVVQQINYAGSPIMRATREGQPKSEPTCFQAEVLYPQELSTLFLKTIYTATEHHADIIHGQFGAIDKRPVEVIVDPGAFE